MAKKLERGRVKAVRAEEEALDLCANDTSHLVSLKFKDLVFLQAQTNSATSLNILMQDAK